MPDMTDMPAAPENWTEEVYEHEMLGTTYVTRIRRSSRGGLSATSVPVSFATWYRRALELRPDLDSQ